MINLGERQQAVIYEALKTGIFVAQSEAERRSAVTLHTQGYLARDPKASGHFYPTAMARAELSGGQYVTSAIVEEERVPLADGPYQLLPPLTRSEFEALEADILANGVLVPVEYDEDGAILDGHHRVAICEKHGIKDWPRFVRKGLSEDRKRSLARSLNCNRRHLSISQKREIIEAQLRETPAASSRKIAEQLNVDHKTVSAARKRLSDGGEIPHQTQIVGRDGVAQPAFKPIRTMFLPEPANFREMKTVVKAKRAEDQKIRHAVRTDLAVQIASRQNATPWWQGVGQDEGRAYPVIYVDPPWRFKTFSDVTGGEKSAENHYPVMDLDDITSLGCPGAASSALVMWVTDLATGIKVLERWGYTYKSFWGWKKIYPGEQAGTGYWSFDNLELLLIGTRGDFPAPIPGTQPIKCTDHDVGRHSEKPVWFAEQIDRLYPTMPKLEMFQREESLAADDIRLRGKWEFWGNQAGTPEGGEG
jgi:N6-adenosine-specific RNA methylase IME4